MDDKKWMESYEAGTLSEAEELALLRRARAHHQKQKQQVAEMIRQQEMQQAEPARKIPFRRKIGFAIAASILLAIVGWWFWGQQKPEKDKNSAIYAVVTPKAMFNEVIAPPSPDIKQMGTHTVPIQDLTKRFVALYDAQKYADCVTLFADSLADDVKLAIPWAYCHLQQGNYPKSIAILEKYYAHPEFAKDEVRWWLGLAHGLNGNIEAMKKYLRQIQPEQYHYQEARKLL
jgi:hypothetical protein